MLRELFVVATLLLTVCAQSPGNLTGREAMCNTLCLPTTFTKFLKTTFLGPRRFIEAGSVNYTYFQFGPLNPASTGRPLIAVAGQGATATIWTPDLLQTLAQGRQVTIFTNKCLGLSVDSQETQATSIEDYAESTVDLIDALQLDQPDMLGWSMGGIITLTVAANYPDAVNRMVVTGTTSGGPGKGYSSQSQSLLQHIIPLASAGLPVPVSSNFPDADAGNAGLCRFLASQKVMPQEATTTEQIKAQFKPVYAAITDPDATLYNQLGNITNPALVIAGSQDMALSVQDDYTLVNQIPGASFLQFADAGHAAILQHAVTAGEVISAFLDA